VERNIKLSYFLSFAFHAWFWMGNWVFYYLGFGGYATVALLDSGAMMATMIFEIPTGAFADMIGKKKTLILAFLTAGVGNILMGMATELWMLALSLWLFVNLGGALYSGTIDALLYDSLKSLKREGEYEKKIGVLRASRLWAMAGAGVIGGWAYQYGAGLPFIMNGAMNMVGLVACFALVEPKIDSVKYSWDSFFRQNTVGLKNLFGTASMRKLSYFLVGTGAMTLVIYNLLDDLLAIEYGFTPFTISVLFSIACLIAGAASIYIPRMKYKLAPEHGMVWAMIAMSGAMIVSPIVGMAVASILLWLRVILEVVYENASSVVINSRIESRHRATTISSLSFLHNLPYALFGSLLGWAVEMVGGAKMFSMWFGLVLLTVTVVFGMRMLPRRR
jgi:MFS family permease